MDKIPQSPVVPSLDLRDMLRRYIISRGLTCMEEAGARRRAALHNGDISKYRSTIQTAVRDFYGELPAGRASLPVKSKQVSCFEKKGYKIENFLFDSFPGWEVNATVYVPLDYVPPFPAVIIPVGHSGKQFASYQLPCQLFARSGYVAVVFDPPGQAGEKRPGNDHFVDGVRCYLVGQTSSQYFIADALRCIDYLETRDDVDLSYGVAMTGVSGGGTTTILANLLDDRISVTGPSCCLTSLADLDITQCYAGCPETHMWKRYAEGIDEIDLLCVGAPKPILLMAGIDDSIFRIDDTRKLADEVAEFYKTVRAKDCFDFFIDKGGHGYSLTQARTFTRFMNSHLLKRPDRTICDLPDDKFVLDPYEQIQSKPRTDVNMRSLSLKRACELKAARRGNPEGIRDAAAKVTGVGVSLPVPEAEAGETFRVWTHYWQQVLLKPEAGIELPVTFLSAGEVPAASILHFDDKHRNRLLHRNGVMGRSINFINEADTAYNLLSVDLRGWGDTEPAMYPFELAGWGSIDRYLAYATTALGDPLMSMRIRDGLASLAYLRSRPEVDSDGIVITGCGLGGIVALHVAAIDTRIKGVLVWDTLYSFMSLLETEDYTWPHDTFVPNVLLQYDLPELISALTVPVSVLNPLDGRGKSLPVEVIKALNIKPEPLVYCPSSKDDAILEPVGTLLNR